MKVTFATTLLLSFAVTGLAEEPPQSKPIELEVLKSSIGVWDAEIEVWPDGVDADSIKFKGVETNRPYGEYWIASDFDSEFQGQTMKVHSIVGYDLDQKKLFGLIIDHGPFSARMTGDYDAGSKTVTWMTAAKDIHGKPLVQKTTITHKKADERNLILMVPGEKEDEFIKFMQIRYLKRP